MHCADASIFCFFYLVICFYSCWGVEKIMVTGVNKESVLQAEKLVSKHPGFLYYTAGLIFVLL
jgi:Tat protein secretion system quality control protein TatD with DNase activity